LVSPSSRRVDVIVDTSALHARDFDQFASSDFKRAVSEGYPALEVSWLIPRIVMLEREHQMREGAGEVARKAGPLHRLVAARVDVGAARLAAAVRDTSEQSRDALGFSLLDLDYARCPWDEIVRQAVGREPPFGPGGEKGFRDRLVAETVLQRIANRGDAVERTIFVCPDKLLADFVRARSSGRRVDVFERLDDAGALLHTLSSDLSVEEEEHFRELSQVAFNGIRADFRSFRDDVIDAINQRFAKQLHELPPGALVRFNNAPGFSTAAFLGKEYPTLRWRSRATILAQYWTPQVQMMPNFLVSQLAPPTTIDGSTGLSLISGLSWDSAVGPGLVVPSSSSSSDAWLDGRPAAIAAGAKVDIVPPSGTLLRYDSFNEFFDVEWTTELAGDHVRNPTLVDIVHQRA